MPSVQLTRPASARRVCLGSTLRRSSARSATFSATFKHSAVSSFPAYLPTSPELTQSRIALIRKSWAAIKASDEDFNRRFYSILFTNYPGVKSLFKSDKQPDMFGSYLDKTIEKLDSDIEQVVADLVKLAKRHNKYGTLPAHYGPVGECLVQAIQEFLGEDLDPETADAWGHLYGVVCEIMLPITEESVA